MMMRSFNFVPLVVIFLASARIEIVARGFTRLGMILSRFRCVCFVVSRGRGRISSFSFFISSMQEFRQRFVDVSMLF